ncbi:MAG: ABC transporter permease, partial [Clostridia bacterium]|nr:ABC transporter permease [Clostridia bacterium]
MTTMMDGTVPTDPQTGLPGEPIEGFDNVWQIIGSVSGDSAADSAGGAAGMSMDITSMCNINMLYFFIAVLVCIFVAEDFRSGYAKNLFTVRAKKTDYVISKTVVCFVGGALMILGFFVGAMLGGAICNGMLGLSLAMEGFHWGNIILCVLSKMLLVSVFVPIYLIMSVATKQKLWLSLVLSLMVGMFLFMMIPMLTPLNATVMNVLLCAVGGVLFGVGLGAISNRILNQTSLV